MPEINQNRENALSALIGIKKRTEALTTTSQANIETSTSTLNFLKKIASIEVKYSEVLYQYKAILLKLEADIKANIDDEKIE